MDDVNDVSPYSAIAKGYDLIMSHVDYRFWAEYTDKLIWLFCSEPRSIRELGCGTGTFALHLQPLGNYEYTATDLCPEMIEVGRKKAEELNIPITFAVEDFRDVTAASKHDVIILLYDGLNYLREEEEILSLFSSVYQALKPGGVFFFDQSTPANSINNEDFFRDEGEMEGFSYVRGSEYDRNTCLHTTTFEINVDGQSFFERHIQRAYTLNSIEALLNQTPLQIEEAFDGFSAEPASERSERIHWIVRRPA